MYEIDFLKAGEKKDADAICLRFDRPDGGGRAVVVIDAGWQDDGDAVVEFVRQRYGTSQVDLAIVSHPDGDHIGGMGKVIRELKVAGLLVHRLDQRGGVELDAGGAVADLVQVATAYGVPFAEPFQGAQYLGGALTILGPSEGYYTELLGEQKLVEAKKSDGGSALLAALAETGRHFADRVLDALPFEEIPFGEGPGPGPRNNSSTVILFAVEDFRALFTGDAGVPAIDAALDFAATAALDALAPDLIQIPHHGSRRNAHRRCSIASWVQLVAPRSATPTSASAARTIRNTRPAGSLTLTSAGDTLGIGLRGTRSVGPVLTRRRVRTTALCQKCRR